MSGREIPDTPVAFLRALERSTVAGITAVDTTGRQIYVNPAFCAMVGWSAEELVGAMPPFRYWTTDHSHTLARGLKEALGTGPPPAGLDRTFRRRSGETFPVHLAIAPLFDDSGAQIGLTANVIDISNLRRLEVEASRLRQAVEGSGEAIALTDRDGVFTYVNPEFTRLYGHASEDIVGRLTPRILKSGALPPEWYAAFWQDLLAGRVVRNTIPNRTKDGRLVTVDSSVTPVLGAGGAIVGFLAIQRDVTERERINAQLRSSDEALRESEARYRGLFESSPLPTWVIDPETGLFTAVNDAAISHYGYSSEEFLAMSVGDLHLPADLPGLAAHARTVWATGAPTQGTWRHRKKDGTLIDVEIVGQEIAVHGRRLRISYGRDVTEKRLLEEQFRQAQKMEAVGRLAGGVAHDFNNLLSVILSYTSISLDSLVDGDPMREDLAEIETAARRASELTGQLLAFSRHQVLEPRIVDLNESLAKLEKILRRLLGEDIVLQTIAAPSLWAVKVDPGQIEQVVMNLAVNARDAMPAGGHLTIATANVDLDETGARTHPGTHAGPHVMLAVTDDGVGMDAETQRHIFEPFFTTKEVGKGTGLGLSTVFGIVRQSGGSIRVTSEPGWGTTFEIYIPRCEHGIEASREAAVAAPLHHGGECVLLAEDEAQLRLLVTGILQRKGYEVLAAASPAEALALSELHGGRIDLLLTDIVMPGMNGYQLAERLRAVRPTVKIVYMSGYTGSFAIDLASADEGATFLQKPVTPDLLLRKVRQALDAV